MKPRLQMRLSYVVASSAVAILALIGFNEQLSEYWRGMLGGACFAVTVFNTVFAMLEIYEEKSK